MIQIKLSAEVKPKKKHLVKDYEAFIVHTKEGYDFLHLVTDEGIVFCGISHFELFQGHQNIEDFIEEYYTTNPEWVRMYEDFDSFYLQFTEDENGSYKTLYF